MLCIFSRFSCVQADKRVRDLPRYVRILFLLCCFRRFTASSPCTARTIHTYNHVDCQCVHKYVMYTYYKAICIVDLASNISCQPNLFRPKSVDSLHLDGAPRRLCHTVRQTTNDSIVAKFIRCDTAGLRFVVVICVICVICVTLTHFTHYAFTRPGRI